MPNYKEISTDEFKKLSLEQQRTVINEAMKIEKTLKAVADVLGINSKHYSEKFRNAGYTFSKAQKGFYLPSELTTAEEIKKPVNAPEGIIKTKETKTKKEYKEIKESSNLNNNDAVNFFKPVPQSSINLYYSPTGNLKKFGASCDVEVYKQFEILCNKLNFVNKEAHISNALALYVKMMNLDLK